jgi:NhaA family Na+:H+ antiporter
LTTDIEDTIRDSSTPLQRWETFLIYPIGIIVLPLFALFNAGVSLSMTEMATAFHSPVTQGIVAGLVIGKPLGVCLLVYLGLKLKIGSLPEGMKFSEVAGAGMLAGIGFTMSLFVTALSFENALHLIDEAKIGILVASIISAVCAIFCISVISFNRQKT